MISEYKNSAENMDWLCLNCGEKIVSPWYYLKTKMEAP
jgi:hypothetical protein